ncbi:MAG TPA: ABC transporter substrate-binding protein [Candidatus Bathyarchaeia archaeon]|nr:ABC transporter substrate-binding protein [Candidatus Bathyarchaeia archaeon]
MISKLKILTVTLFFAVLVASSFLPGFAQTFQHGGTLHLALPNTIDNFSQFLTSSYQAWYFNQMVYPDLGVPTAFGLLHLALSGYWSNPSATTWYFMIRPGMTWSDGVPVNATDLAYSIQLMFSTFTWGAGSLSGYASSLTGSITNSVKVDNSTVVEIDFNSPNGLMGDIIGSENTPNLVPYHIWKNYIVNGTSPGPNFGTLVGAGAFYVSNYTQGDTQVVLLPNPHGSPFGGDPSQSGVPYLNQITVLLVPTTQGLSLMLKGGQIDAAPVAPSDVAGLTSASNFQVTSGPTPDTWNLEYPIWNYPYNQLAFRQALAYAINRTDLVQTALAGYGTPGNEGYIPPEMAPEFNSSVPEYNYNPQMAQSLLQSLGWTQNSNGYYQTQNGTVFSPTLYVPAEQQPEITAGNRIIQDLRAVGIDAQLQTIATTSMVEIWDKGTNMYLHEQNYGYPNSELLSTTTYSFTGFGTGPPLVVDAAHPVFTPASVWQYYNQTVKQLYAAGSADQRNQLMQTLQEIVAQQLPSITLYYVNSVWVYNTANFGGWPTSPSTMDWPGGMFNMTALASIYSLSAQTMTSSTSSSSSSGGSNMMTYIVGAIVVIVLIAAVAVKARKKGGNAPTAPTTNP